LASIGNVPDRIPQRAPLLEAVPTGNSELFAEVRVAWLSDVFNAFAKALLKTQQRHFTSCAFQPWDAAICSKALLLFSPSRWVASSRA